ncbi:MAG: 50S ribosomal protein L30 [Chloroflexi bacterium]|nr:50S ribosomal protein L30 [Anaerolineae bacterium]NMC01202.1 50S ribosomal protein L30 [Chloroflexota bacterium]OQB03312.1 MAG: 50S ribosomal protein L30 [Chloroflexi bacterium ADurb.Bin222]HOC21023.1 50S ribosomal protein L30 [Anaerolineae bacterium]HOS78687.1 50S ribosomal protein L30 [Anaerolineae bacterium]
MAKMLQITLLRSPIGYNERQKRTVRALGLRRIRQTVVRPDNPAVRGMVAAIPHLVRAEEIEVVEVPAAEQA